MKVKLGLFESFENLAYIKGIRGDGSVKEEAMSTI